VGSAWSVTEANSEAERRRGRRMGRRGLIFLIPLYLSSFSKRRLGVPEERRRMKKEEREGGGFRV